MIYFGKIYFEKVHKSNWHYIKRENINSPYGLVVDVLLIKKQSVS